MTEICITKLIRTGWKTLGGGGGGRIVFANKGVKAYDTRQQDRAAIILAAADIGLASKASLFKLISLRREQEH
jgi:hypothetical protein